jgi:AcrR family transcriptional regulator
MMVEGTRSTAAERRGTVLVAAQAAFARGGLHGTSTEDIAEAAGIFAAVHSSPPARRSCS